MSDNTSSTQESDSDHLLKELIYKSPLSVLSTRDTCRICLSASGELLSPCGCIGTIANIHSTCLSHWVNLTNKKTCELCNESYCIKGVRFNSLRRWSKPHLSSDGLWRLLNVGGLVYAIIYTCKLYNERLTSDRLLSKTPFRADDLIRTTGLFFSVLCLIFIVRELSLQLLVYLNKQKTIMFCNKPRVVDA